MLVQVRQSNQSRNVSTATLVGWWNPMECSHWLMAPLLIWDVPLHWMITLLINHYSGINHECLQCSHLTVCLEFAYSLAFEKTKSSCHIEDRETCFSSYISHGQMTLNPDQPGTNVSKEPDIQTKYCIPNPLHGRILETIWHFELWITLCNRNFVPGKYTLFFNCLYCKSLENGPYFLQILVLCSG